MDRAAAQRQRDVLQREHARESLVNAASLQAVRCRHAGLPTLWNLTSRSRFTPTAQRISRPEHDLHEIGIDVKDHQRLRDDRDDDDAEERAEDADMPAAERSAADDGRGEGEDQPVVADRGLTELQARDQHDPGERGEKAGNRMRPDRRARNRNAGEFGRVRVAADGENVAPDLLAIKQIPHAGDDQRSGQREPRNGPENRGIAEGFDARGNAVERLRARYAEIRAP